MAPKSEEKISKRQLVRNAFRPSTPIDRYDLFSGRITQTDKIIGAIIQPGQHVILYGERGVGKTSMAKVIAEILNEAGIKTVNSDTINCDPSDSYESIWKKAFCELRFRVKRNPQYFEEEAVEEEICLLELVDASVTPDDVRRALSTIPETTVVVFDEFDRVTDEAAKKLMADTIKNLSDHSVSTTLILVGVAQSVTDLIGQHQSIDRALVQVRMPRMSYSELGGIVDKGLKEAGLIMNEGVKDKIIRLSHGLPHYTHLLSLEAGLAAVARESEIVENEDFSESLARTIEDRHSIGISYHNAVASAHKESTFAQTLLSCALSPVDDQGCFTAGQVASAMGVLIQKNVPVSHLQRHITEFTTERRGGILEKFGSKRNFRYRFSNPLLQPYTIIRSLADRLITESQLWLMGEATYR